MTTSVRDVHALANQLGTIMSGADECRVMDLLMSIPPECIAKDIDDLFSLLEDFDISRTDSIFEFKPGSIYLAKSQEFGDFLRMLAKSSFALATEEREGLIAYAEYLSTGFDEDAYMGRTRQP